MRGMVDLGCRSLQASGLFERLERLRVSRSVRGLGGLHKLAPQMGVLGPVSLHSVDLSKRGLDTLKVFGHVGTGSFTSVRSCCPDLPCLPSGSPSYVPNCPVT